MVNRIGEYFKNRMSPGDKYKIADDQEEIEEYLEPTNQEEYDDCIKLTSLSPADKERRILYLWGKAYKRAKSAGVIL